MPLRDNQNQYIECNSEMYSKRNVCSYNIEFNYKYGALGFSVHITENTSEIVTGAPGIFRWAGSVVRHKKNKYGIYESEIPDPGLSDYEEDAFFGYAVSSGYFNRAEKSKLYYIASAPRSNLLNGSVQVFDIIEENEMKVIKVHKKFEGEQMGEYFGYSLITEDFNGDGHMDIAVGAPFHTFSNLR